MSTTGTLNVLSDHVCQSMGRTKCLPINKDTQDAMPSIELTRHLSNQLDTESIYPSWGVSQALGQMRCFLITTRCLTTSVGHTRGVLMIGAHKVSSYDWDRQGDGWSLGHTSGLPINWMHMLSTHQSQHDLTITEAHKLSIGHREYLPITGTYELSTNNCNTNCPAIIGTHKVSTHD